jgi:putative ABC transport system permease protein
MRNAILDLLKVAIRNVGRNKRRSLITAITVFIGIVVVCGTKGLLNGLQAEIRGGLTRKVHGDLQIHKFGYRDVIDSNPYKIMIPFDEKRDALILGAAGVAALAPRLRVMALLNHQKSQTSTPVMIIGIDSSRELIVCPRLLQAVQVGHILDSTKERQETKTPHDSDLEAAPSLDDTPKDTVLEQAKVEAGDGNHQIMITPSLMTGLNASLGDEIVILIQDRENMQQAIVTKITAVIDYALPTATTRMAWMDFSTLQSLTKSTGLASEIAIQKSDEALPEQVKANITAIADQGTITETWMELSGFLSDLLGIQDAVFSVIVVVVFSIMISAIINTSLMTVMERTREIGTLSALGYRRKHIMFLFMAESSAISVLGGTVGSLTAMLLMKILSYKGLIFALPGQKIPAILYPFVPFSFVVFAVALAFVSSLIASLIPAYRASRMKPVDALNSV